MKISPPVKGLITAVVMTLITLYMFNAKTNVNSPIRYSIYIVYAAGIIWTLMDYSRSPAFNRGFGPIFGQGFRCFIVVTLIMVTFTGIFISMHPEFAIEDAKLYREFLIAGKNTLPADIETMVASEQKSYLVKNVSMATFGFLIQGALYTAIGTGILLMRRR